VNAGSAATAPDNGPSSEGHEFITRTAASPRETTGMSGETGSRGGQNAEFKGPESRADPEAFRSWAFEKAREEPLKYATWLTLNAATESVTSLQRLLEPGDREVEEWASEATQGGRQLAYATWLALDATINGLCSLQEKLPHAERWGWFRRVAHMKNQREPSTTC
jgi:hypothetical protein